MKIQILAVALIAVTAAPVLAAETQTYRYDALGRLVKVEHAGQVNHEVIEDYQYDAAGNRQRVIVSGQRIIVVPLMGLSIIPLGSGS